MVMQGLRLALCNGSVFECWVSLVPLRLHLLPSLWPVSPQGMRRAKMLAFSWGRWGLGRHLGTLCAQSTLA